MSEQRTADEDPAAQDDPTRGDGAAPDTVALTGTAVVLAAVAGVCALLGGQFLIGALRLAAGILAGLGLGAGVLALGLPRRRPRTVRVIAAATAVAVGAALTVPAVLATRAPPLSAHAVAEVAPLAEGDRVSSVPGAGAPVLIRRADGTGQLLTGHGVEEIEAATEDVLALSSDGTRVLHVAEGRTEVLAIADDAPPTPAATLAGEPIALAGDRAVMRACADDSCRISGYDLSAAPADDAEGPPAQWTLTAAEGIRGPDPAGIEVPARTDSPPGLLDAVRATGVVPAVPLRFDPAQGWVQLDPATGFPVGRILASAQQDCRIAATRPAPEGPQLQESGPVVLTVCSDEDGAMTATAFREGQQLWQSEPSPGGQWSVRLEAGRVLATGTEAGTDTAGEILASAERGAWTPPGGDALAESTALTSRIGIDGARMVATNESGQLVAYDTATGENTWTLPAGGAGVRGRLTDGTAVMVDPLERTAALEARGPQRLRVIDAATGDVTLVQRLGTKIDRMRGVSGGRALITGDGRTLLVGR